MRTTEASTTAMFAAIARGQHRERHPGPWVLDDPFSLPLVGPSWRAILERLEALFPPPLTDEAIAAASARSRYVEDRLAEGSFAQYVILGAGLDSFAWRRPDVLDALRVFEVDHPASQAYKRARSEALGLPRHDRHVFASLDLETESLGGALSAAGFDWTRPALFCCLGVLPYLSVRAAEAALSTVAATAPGSEIIASYAVTEPYLDRNGRRFLETLSGLAAEAGEGITTLLSPADVEALLERCGLHVAGHASRDDLRARYFAGRPDQLRPYTVERLVCAVVPLRG